MNTEKIPGDILNKVKWRYNWHNPFDKIISILYVKHLIYPNSAEYNWERNMEYIDVQYIQSIFNKPISDIIEYLKTFPQDYIFCYHASKYEFSIKKKMVEPDEKYILRLLNMCISIDKMFCDETEHIMNIEAKLREINDILSKYE